MLNDNRDYVKLNEIELIVHKDLDYLFGLIKQDSLFNTVFYLVDTGLTNVQETVPVYVPSYEPAPNYPPVIQDNNYNINRYELDIKLQNIIKDLFAKVNVSLDNLPARVYSNYSDQYQKVKNKLTNLMDQNHRDYFTKNEAEYYIKESMQQIIDEIFYYDQTCVICQDKFKLGEKIGILSCGHIYHKDCIYNWLNSDVKKSCPLCRQENVIVEKQETVLARKVL